MELSIARITWRIWPWMNWIVPAFVCLHGLLGNGGWESLVLIPASVVLVPGTALLGALPRFLLRKRGHLSTPMPIVPLLFIMWWGWICFGGAMPGVTDSAPLPSIFNALSGERLPSAIEMALMLGGAAVAIAAWITVLIIAIVRAAKGPKTPRRASVILAWATAFLIPVALIATCVAGVRIGASALDAHGDTFAAAEARDRDTRDDLDRQRYEMTQQALSQVRALISQSDWTRANVRAQSSSQCPWAAEATECYSLEAGFGLESSGALDFEALDEALNAKGWAVHELTTDRWGAMELDTHSPDGVSITIRYSQGEAGEHFVNTTATSPSWWGSPYDVRLNSYDVDVDAIYPADEYPPA